MNTPEEALKERIKELTCLYEVSSILVNADPEDHEETFKAIAFSIKRAFQYPEYTEITIQQDKTCVKTGVVNTETYIASPINLFNKEEGILKVYLTDHTLSFLVEEQQLIDNIALKIGDFLERVVIKQNEVLLRRQM